MTHVLKADLRGVVQLTFVVIGVFDSALVVLGLMAQWWWVVSG